MNLACVILAAGLGKRMKSSLPKVLHTICGAPMLQYVLDAADRLRPEKKIVVVGKHSMDIEKAVRGSGISYAMQKEPKGTGNALLSSIEKLGRFKGPLLVLNGDMPAVTVKTLRRFLTKSRANKDALSVLSFIAEDPSAYGRVVRGASGANLRIVEDRDASPAQKKLKEVNSGVYVITPECMKLLTDITINKAKGEYYLTDLLEIAAGKGMKTGVYCLGSEEELMGVNTRRDILKAEGLIQHRIIDGFIEKGVRFIDPASVHIHHSVNIGRETVIYPNVFLEGSAKIGCGCVIYPNVRIADSVVGDRAEIKDSSVIEASVIKHEAQIGPFAHIRPGSVIGSGAKIGNFVEVKKSSIGSGTKASHLSYLGDSVIGKEVNIGAGTITCNYNGREKHRTIIGNDVFIGSDTQLIAPVNIGNGAFVGAGSTITRDVPPLTLAISRTKQENIEGWAKRKSREQKP